MTITGIRPGPPAPVLRFHPPSPGPSNGVARRSSSEPAAEDPLGER